MVSSRNLLLAFRSDVVFQASFALEIPKETR
jgi:hypothetical protein